MRRAIATRSSTYLRKPTTADGPEFVERVRDSASHLAPFIEAADSLAAYAQWLVQGDRPEIEQFLVCRRADDAIAGFVNLNNLVRGALQAAVAGWASFVPHVGVGHATDGLDMVLEVAFTQLRLHRVEANVQPANERSRALALRCGFRMEGFSPRYLMVDGDWRDHERWAIDREMWRAGRSTT